MSLHRAIIWLCIRREELKACVKEMDAQDALDDIRRVITVAVKSFVLCGRVL